MQRHAANALQLGRVLEAGDLIFLPHLASRAGCWSGRLAAADNLQQDEDRRTCLSAGLRLIFFPVNG
jgi:hypothetical protein